MGYHKGVNCLVSVAMASYNGEKYIRVQIESILANLSDEDELIISDDGSTDNTVPIIESIKDSRIRLIEGPKKGINMNFANAINNCKGDIIFLSDQDDYWYPNKVSKVLDEFKKDSRILLVEHDARIVDGKGNIIEESFFKIRRVREGFFLNWIRNTYHGCCMAFRKSLTEHLIIMPSKGCFHDQWIGLIAELHGEIFFLNCVLMDYKRYDNNASSFKQYPLHTQLVNRFCIGFYLLKNFYDIYSKKLNRE